MYQSSSKVSVWVNDGDVLVRNLCRDASLEGFLKQSFPCELGISIPIFALFENVTEIWGNSLRVIALVTDIDIARIINTLRGVGKRTFPISPCGLFYLLSSKTVRMLSSEAFLSDPLSIRDFDSIRVFHFVQQRKREFSRKQGRKHLSRLAG